MVTKRLCQACFALLDLERDGRAAGVDPGQLQAWAHARRIARSQDRGFSGSLPLLGLKDVPRLQGGSRSAAATHQGEGGRLRWLEGRD